MSGIRCVTGIIDFYAVSIAPFLAYSHIRQRARNQWSISKTRFYEYLRGLSKMGDYSPLLANDFIRFLSYRRLLPPPRYSQITQEVISLYTSTRLA